MEAKTIIPLGDYVAHVTKTRVIVKTPDLPERLVSDCSCGDPSCALDGATLSVTATAEKGQLVTKLSKKTVALLKSLIEAKALIADTTEVGGYEVSYLDSGSIQVGCTYVGLDQINKALKAMKP